MMKFIACCFFSLFLLAASAQHPVYPRYNQVFSVATHNSYWVKRTSRNELFASGTQERLLDQLLFDHARALEIDIHKMPRKRGQWAVYHTDKKRNVLIHSFADFLKQMQQFQYSLPKHEVVTVVLELKEIFNNNFDKSHTPAELDSLLERYLGEWLYRPCDLQKRCPNAADLCGCVESSKGIWPTIDELRGKFIFLVLGNFHTVIGHGGKGWATYGASENPSAFPMSTDISVFNKGGSASERVSPALLSKAYRASVFQQVENVGDEKHLKEVHTFLAKDCIVRGHDSYSLADQQARIGQGFQMLQTDYPWVHYRDMGFAQPFGSIDSSKVWEPGVFNEPGNRVFLSSAVLVFWMLHTSQQKVDWETLPSSTRPSPNPAYPNPAKPYGKGCLCAQSDIQNSICICRKVNEKQNAVITVEAIKNGHQSIQQFITENNTIGMVVDYIRMVVEQKSGQAGCEVVLYSSAEMGKGSKGVFQPRWNLLAKHTFSVSMIKQGIAASEGDVLFTGTKRSGYIERTI